MLHRQSKTNKVNANEYQAPTCHPLGLQILTMAANYKDNTVNVFNSVAKMEIDSIVKKITKISSKIKVKESKLLHVKLKEDGSKTWTCPEVPKEHLGGNKAENTS